MPGALVRECDRVTLRAVEPEDAPFRQRAGANPELRYPLGTYLRPQSAYDADDDDVFLVCLEDDPEPGAPDDVTRIGAVSVEDANYKRPELGYWIVPEAQGEGYATEAVGAAIDFAFRTYPTPAVGAHVFVDNDASRGLLESLGFEEEGLLRGYTYVNGEHRDAIQYGLLRENWDGWQAGVLTSDGRHVDR